MLRIWQRDGLKYLSIEQKERGQEDDIWELEAVETKPGQNFAEKHMLCYRYLP